MHDFKRQPNEIYNCERGKISFRFYCRDRNQLVSCKATVKSVAEALKNYRQSEVDYKQNFTLYDTDKY